VRQRSGDERSTSGDNQHGNDGEDQRASNAQNEMLEANHNGFQTSLRLDLKGHAKLVCISVREFASVDNLRARSYPDQDT
jgi:hypothetical protein